MEVPGTQLGTLRLNRRTHTYYSDGSADVDTNSSVRLYSRAELHTAP